MRVNKEPYRAISWWLTWDDVSWPDRETAEKIRRRADKAAEAGVNCAIIFGAHFRWDFMPLWSRLHDLLAFIGEELHKRQIRLFDHHSSVLAHRPRTRDETWDIWRRNRHHVPFYPSPEAAANLTFKGQLINEWRMIDVETGKPAFLPAYIAEQFCMNNPFFQKAYQGYVVKLVKDTGLDGLVSDDGIFYGGWRVCACPWCRKRFQREYGHTLPPVTDTSFWGNYDSEAFKDWIAMRFQTSSDFLAGVRKVLGTDFPLLTCCSSSIAHTLPAYGMTYQDFIKSCNIVMLEMCGSTPALDGTWDNRAGDQLLHLGIARDNNARACIGLGYGFFPDTAFFVWAVNKFLGSDSWFSTLKGRLGLPASETGKAGLRDEAELVEEGYVWEKNHPQLFTGRPAADVAVFFSRCTRDYYGQWPGYVRDYKTTCNELMKNGIEFEVVTAVPSPGQWPILVLSSVICLGPRDRKKLDRYLQDGGVVVASGPLGLRDDRARRTAKSWLKSYGIDAELIEPDRVPGFPPHPVQDTAVACVGYYGRKQIGNTEWVNLKINKGWLCWSPGRISVCNDELKLADKVRTNQRAADLAIARMPRGWYMRRFRKKDRILLYGLPAKVKPILHKTLQNQFLNQGIIEKLRYQELSVRELLIICNTLPVRIKVYSPDLSGARIIGFDKDEIRQRKPFAVDLSGIKRFFIVEIVMRARRRISNG